MTRYRFDNQERKQALSWKRALGAVFGVLAMLAIIFFIIAPIIRSISRGPAWMRHATTTAISDQLTMLSSKRQMLDKIRALENQIASFETQTTELGMLRDENDALRKELSYPRASHASITASIIAKPSLSLYNSLIIDRGTIDGVSEGDLVTAQGTIALGTIAKVSDHSATVQLFSGPQFADDLILKGPNITVPATGKGGGNFEIHIPREVEVADGELLAIPTHPDLAVGVVKSIEFDARDPFQTVLARVPVNVQELRFVEVIK